MSMVLDETQRAVCALPADRSVLLLGEAGFGKTTAALHRLATLHRGAPGEVDALVLVPSPGLASEVRLRLRRLGVEADVCVLDAWLAREARRAFPELAPVDSEHASPRGIRLKRHPAVREVLDEWAELRDEPAHRDDLFELWGDRRWLRDIVDAAAGDLCRHDADAVEAHARVQFAELDRHEDGSLVLGVHGQPVHLGTPLHDAGTSDVEDYPWLFELERRRGGRRRPRRYDHVVVDEAQEVAPEELALVGRCLRRGGTLTVVGDAHQQVDPSAWFAGWSATLEELGAAGAAQRVLAHSHRCPPEVVALARALRDGHPVPEGSPAVQRVEGDAPALAAWLGGVRRAAVVAWSEASARAAHRRLPRSLGARLMLDGASPVGRGVTVTVPSRLHGVEVDRVAVPDLSPHGWPATEPGRRALYVAVTRAVEGVWLGTPDVWSPLVAGDLSPLDA